MTFDAVSQANAEDDLDAVVCGLFAAYAKPICAYIHSLVGEWQLAHDLTQETYLQLYRTRRRLPAVENQRAWVYGIASHIALNELKRRRRFIWLPWHQSENEAQLTWTMVETDIQQRAALEQALAALSPDYRAPLLLYSGYGFSVREVAATLAISEAAVKQRLHRAREMFRQAYERSEE